VTVELGSDCGHRGLVEKKMWILLWKDTVSNRSGALECPGGQSHLEACGHLRALRALFPRRLFRVAWIAPDSGRLLN